MGQAVIGGWWVVVVVLVEVILCEELESNWESYICMYAVFFFRGCFSLLWRVWIRDRIRS
jgi:hypothetical protein